MAISQRNNIFFSTCTPHRIQALISLLQQRSKQTFAGEVEHASSLSDAEKDALLDGLPMEADDEPVIEMISMCFIFAFIFPIYIDSPTRLALDSRGLGIKGSMISSPVWTILRKLHQKGFETYLVGGCVRDILLKRIPKDFDVITTAKLAQIKKEFRRCHIVGRRFPICRVNIQDSIVEVSSFEITGENVEANKVVDFSQIPSRARILRGLRIAARLGWHFSRETASAIRDLSTSITNLDKSRLMMELNFMLAYGAAKPSFHLLHRFKLLEIMLPIHGAYLAKQAQPTQSSTMLMGLLSSMDKLLACDRYADCSLW
ncbi:hypothetical protein ACLOJK_002397 [Asimina triloba]